MKRNYWPLGILCIIFVGVILLVFLVIISTKQSTAADDSYEGSKLVVDTNINDYIKLQEHFESNLLPYISVNKKVEFDENNRIYTPYFTKHEPIISANDKDKLEKIKKLRRDFTFDKKQNVIFLSFKDIKKPNNIKIHSITLELDSMQSKPKSKDNIIIKLTQDGANAYKSDEFSLPKDGAYNGVFKIGFTSNDSQNKENIFYKKVFFNATK